LVVRELFAGTAADGFVQISHGNFHLW
jgi:hypothetical protein